MCQMEWEPLGAEGWGCCMRGWVWWCLRWLRSPFVLGQTRGMGWASGVTLMVEAS